MGKPLYAVRIAKLRNSKKLTQQQLADLLGLTRGRINNYEQGTREPDYETLEKIADFFNTTTDYLLGRDMKSTEKSRYHSPDQATDDPELQKRFAERAEYYKVAEEAADAKIPPDKIRKFLELFKDSNDK